MEQMLTETNSMAGTVSALPARRTDSPPYTFSSSQIARLRIYRAAVTAGFYTDQRGPAGWFI
jgi:hypothetical protein